jgi:hypothetical protein
MEPFRRVPGQAQKKTMSPHTPWFTHLVFGHRHNRLGHRPSGFLTFGCRRYQSGSGRFPLHCFVSIRGSFPAQPVAITNSHLSNPLISRACTLLHVNKFYFLRPVLGSIRAIRAKREICRHQMTHCSDKNWLCLRHIPDQIHETFLRSKGLILGPDAVGCGPA